MLHGRGGLREVLQEIAGEIKSHNAGAGNFLLRRFFCLAGARPGTGALR